MYKNILLILGLLILGLLLFTACSQVQPEVKEVEPKVEVVTKAPLKTLNRIPVKTETQSEATITEFIPEHIKRSRIEVVEHY